MFNMFVDLCNIVCNNSYSSSFEVNVEGFSCARTWSMHLITFVNNAMRQAHGFVSLITNNKHVTVIMNAKPCAWLMALVTKIMRCILQVRAQEQPHGKCTMRGVYRGSGYSLQV